MATEELDKAKFELDEDELEASKRGLTLFFVVIIFSISICLLLFYSTLRSRSIGIASGYLKAIEIGYQSGEYVFGKEIKDREFETGIYKVKVLVRRNPESGITNLTVTVRDRFLLVTHYSEELKLIPLVETLPE